MSGPTSSSSSSSSLLPSLLSPTNLLPSYASIDHYSLRHLILSRSGLPDHPSWLRSQGWKVLLGFLGSEKKEWPRQEAKKRGEYYELLGDLLPEEGGQGEGRYDALVTQIHLDVVRSRFAQSFSFFRQPVTPSASCPLAPLPSSSKSDGVEPVKRLEKRNALRQRLVALGHIEAGQSDNDDANATPPRSDAILRILFLYALLNPSVGYVQGMVEVAAVVVWTIGSATGMPTTTEEGGGSDGLSHFEADSFWCFSLLLGELRELWDFEGLDSTRAGLRIRNSRDSPGAPAAATGLGGMARALRSLGGRLRWADEELWRHLYDNGLSPSIPYYSFRWLATLLATSLPLPSLVRVWDVILCEAGSANSNAAGPSSSSSSANSQHSQRVDFLLDVVTSLLIFHRQNLLEAVRHHDGSGDEEQQEDIFSRCMTFLQDLPDRDDDIGPVLESARMLRQRRIAADLTGEGGPADDETVKVEPMEGSSGAAGAATMGAKARTAFNRWASSSGSGSSGSGTSTATTTKGGWLRSVSATRDARSNSTSSSAAAAAATSTTSPPPSLLNRLQSSDAAAELSKVGTNWQALAMDKWAQAQARRSASESHAPQAPSSPSESVTSSGTGSSSAFASNLSSRFASLGWGSVGSSANRNGKARAFSTSSSPRIQHPAVMQWSQGASANGGGGGADGMPNFPLPDVMDSPDGRTEYAYVRPASMMMTGLGLGSISPVVDRVQQQQQRRGVGVGVGTIPEEWRSTSTPSRGGSDRSPSLGFTSSSMSSTSSTGSAAGVNGTPRGAGPKPLLLAGSARAAVVPSGDEVHNSTPPAPPSKVVRTGPLAGGSPYTPRGTQRQRGQRKRFGETSFDSSIGGGGGGDESVDGDAADSSVVDLLATPGKTVSGGGGGRDSKDGREASLATSTSLQAALNTEGALPNLPSLRAAKAAGVDTTTITKPTAALRGENGAAASGENGSSSGDGESTVGGPSTSSRLAGGLRAASGRGTVPAGAFGQASASSSNSETQRPAFGSIASSSDVPLVSTEARGSVRRRPPSSSRVLQEEAGGVAVAEGEEELPSSSVPGSPVVADNASIRSASAKHPATRRGAVRRRSTQPTPAAAVAEQARTTPTLPSAPIAPATPSSSSRDSEYRRAGSYEVDDDSPRDRFDEHDAPPQLSHGQGDDDFASSTTIGRKIYTLVDEPVTLTSSNTSNTTSRDGPPPTRRSLTHSQSHDSPPVVGPPPAKLNRRSASSVRSSASSAGSGERTVGSSVGGGSGPIVRSKRSFKTGAKISASRASSSTATSSLPTPRSPLTQEHDPSPDPHRSLRLAEGDEDQHQHEHEQDGTTTADSLASTTRTTAESLPSSSPPSSVVSSPFARGHQALPSIDAQLYADAGGEERRIDGLPTSAARFDEEDAFVDGAGASGRAGSGHAGGGEGYEYYEYFGDEHDQHGGPHRHEEPERMDLPEDEDGDGDENGDGMAAIGSAFRQFSAGMAGSGGDVRRDSAGGIRF